MKIREVIEKILEYHQNFQKNMMDAMDINQEILK